MINTVSLERIQDQLVNTQTRIKIIDNSGFISKAPNPALYIVVFSAWIIALFWFGPRLWSLTALGYSFMSSATIILFVLFIAFAWLYGFYNVGIVLFSLIHKYFFRKPEQELATIAMTHSPVVAILYTTCNDFLESSVISCLQQDYSNYKVYILDDSNDPEYIEKIDIFAYRYPNQVQVIRRKDREGFKAGNMNHALENHVHEAYFAIADADEILPTDFLSKLVPVMQSDEKCGFVQANHRANTNEESPLSRSLGVGVDIHWKYYQPLRNDFGFVMFLGHGALLRRKCWEEIGGFPHLVSEDLAFAIHAREKGYRGRFVENVVCLEDFPETVRSFRIRHMKWTRGTCEFLNSKFKWLIKAKNISWTEKLDILFPTLNLPLTLVYFLFMVVANLLLPYYFGARQNLTLELGTQELIVPVYTLKAGFESIYTTDFFLITLMTFFAPVLCFLIALANNPRQMVQFISHSTALYAALGPLSSIGVLSYLVSRKATFLVTGDKNQGHSSNELNKTNRLKRIKHEWQMLVDRSHPDSYVVQTLEILVGLIFALACIYMFQISFFGLCLAFMLIPVLHKLGWDSKLMRIMAHLPFVFILTGILMAGLSLIGLQTVFFGYGFHF